MPYRRKKLRDQDELEAMMFAFDLGLAFVAGMIHAAEHRQDIIKALQEKEVDTSDPNPTSQTDL